MQRDVARLASEPFDAIVVGGGVYALTIAVELASSGLRVAILERDDFGGATSFNSLKTIHGGIRALQHGAIGEMREFVRERRHFARIAPHLVRPLPFIVPTYRHPVRNRAAMALFLAVYDRLAADRNDGVAPARALPPSRTVGRAECLRLNPAVDPARVTGGAIWHDYQLQAPERFTMALLHSATGAAAANYAVVTRILVRNGTVEGVAAHDRLSGTDFDVRARAVVNAAGPWAWDLLAQAGVAAPAPAPAFSLAMNLVLGRAPLSHAVGGLARGRFLFMVPWRDRSMVGTSHDPHAGPAGRAEVVPANLEAFLRDAATAFPRADISPADIRLVHRGLLPAVRGGAGDALLKRSIVHDHRRDGVRGLVTVIGVRYTTAHATARTAAERVRQALGRSAVPPPAIAPLAGGDIPDLADYERREAAGGALPADTVRRLIGAYGSRYTTVADSAARDARLASPLGSACDVLGAEIDHAVRHEMAVHLSDALLRRTGAGTAGHPGRDAVERAAAIMSEALSWPAGRTASEIAALEAVYARP
jgi:glycerol-3-phosphate dehydrogenase